MIALAFALGFLAGCAFTAWMAVERDDGIGSEGKPGRCRRRARPPHSNTAAEGTCVAGRIALVHEGGDQAHRREAGA